MEEEEGGVARTGGVSKEKMKGRVEEEEGGVARTGGVSKEKMKGRVEEEEGGVQRTGGVSREKMKGRMEEEEGGVARTGGVSKEKMKGRMEEEEGGVSGQETKKASGSKEDGTINRRGRWLTKNEKYAIQCNSCYKWRNIPSKKKYEVISSRISEQPFVCAYAREWKKDIICDAPPDFDEDDPTLLWSIDKPNIPVPPRRFRRDISIRPKESKQFADTYYKAPCGKKLNSTNQAQEYLDNHPEIKANISQFSFSIPKPKAEPPGKGESSKRDMKDGSQSGPEPRKRLKGTEPNSEPMRVQNPGPGLPPRPRPPPGTGTPAKSGKPSASKSSASRKD